MGRPQWRGAAAQPAGAGIDGAGDGMEPDAADQPDSRRGAVAVGATGGGESPFAQRAERDRARQDDDHRGRDGGGGGARNEQSAGGDQRAVTTAGVAVDGSEA